MYEPELISPPSTPLDFHAIFEASPEPYLLLTPQKPFIILEMNAAYLQTATTQREKLVGRPLFEVFPDDPNNPLANGVSNLTASLERVLSTKKPDIMPIQKYDIQTADTTGYKVHYWTPINTPIFNEKNEITAILHRVDDATAFVLAKEKADALIQETESLQLHTKQLAADLFTREQERNQALEKANEEADKRTKEAEIYKRKQSEFTDAICHEARTPLTGIYGCVDDYQTYLECLKEMMLEKKNVSTLELKETLATLMEKFEETTSTLNICVKQQKVILDNALDFAKLEANKLELNLLPFDVKETLSQVIQMFRSQSEQKQLRLVLELPREALLVKGDPHRLSQVLINLLSNAIKFTAEGQITVTLKPVASDETHTDIDITVADTGTGMTVEEQNRLFGRFAQANNSTASEYGGSGLGLAISRQLVAIMGGNLLFKSQKWQGTAFSFMVRYPNLAPHERYNLLNPVSKIRAKPTKLVPKTILIAEDNLMNQKVLLKYLDQQGHRGVIANNGNEAILQRKQQLFDLIFMDLEMPIKNGLEATQEIRAWEKQEQRLPVPIVGLSGNAGVEFKAKALAVGMNDYITKPYVKQTIYDKITVFTVSENVSPSLSPSLTLKSGKAIQRTPSKVILTPYTQQLFLLAPPLRLLSLEFKTAVAQFKTNAKEEEMVHFPCIFVVWNEDNDLHIQLPTHPLEEAHVLLKQLQHLLTPMVTALKLESMALNNDTLIIATANAPQQELVHRFFHEVGLGQFMQLETPRFSQDQVNR